MRPPAHPRFNLRPDEMTQPTRDPESPFRVGVVIPVLNQFELAVKALQSISTIHDVRVFIMPQWRENKTLSEAWNNGIDMAIQDRCTHILVINDDILFTPWTIDALVETINSDESYALVTAHDVSGSYKDHDQGHLQVPKPTDIQVTDSPQFSAFMMTPATFEKIGRFDEVFRPCYWEDNSYHYRIKLLGMRGVVTTAAPYFHFGSTTQNSTKGGIVDGTQFEKNKSTYIKMWGGMPGDEKYLAPWNDATKRPDEGQREIP